MSEAVRIRPPSLFLEEASVCKGERMGDMTVQALIWIGAATILVLYLKRRRKRKIEP